MSDTLPAQEEHWDVLEEHPAESLDAAADSSRDTPAWIATVGGATLLTAGVAGVVYAHHAEPGANVPNHDRLAPFAYGAAAAGSAALGYGLWRLLFNGEEHVSVRPVRGGMVALFGAPW